MRYSPTPMNSPYAVSDADVFSSPLWLSQDYGYAIQAVWTGAELAGTIKLQASNDNINWDDITGTPQTVSGPGSFLWNVTTAFYLYTRVYFVYGSGSGSIALVGNTKGP